MIILATEIAKDAAELATGIGGVAGSIIGVLMGVVTLLSGVIVFMQKRADKVYGYRLAERDTLKDALHEAVVAITNQTSATKERNALLEDLAQTIALQTTAQTQLIERLTMQHGHLENSHERTESVITSISDAMRNVALITSGVKQSVDQMMLNGPSTVNEVKALVERALREVHDANQRTPRSR